MVPSAKPVEPMRPEQVVDALHALLAARPDAEVAAVGVDGIFVDMPAGVPADDHPRIQARAGIELVTAEHRAAVLQQFLELPLVGASNLDAVTIDGQRATYYLFDCTTTYDVVILVVARDVDAAVEPVVLPDAGPVRPRYARTWRTELAEMIRIEPALTEILGFTMEDYAAHDTAYFIHPEDHERSLLNWFDVIGSPPGAVRRWRGRFRCKDDDWLWLEVTNTNCLDDPDDPHVLSEVVDISVEMEAIDDAWEGRELLRRLTEALPVGVLQASVDGTVLYANDRIFDLLGLDREAGLFDAVNRVVEDDRPVLVDAVVRGGRGEDSDIEVRYRRCPDSPLAHLQIAVRALRDRDDAVTSVILSVSDVTEPAVLRQQLEVRATFDSLTGCLNRASIVHEVESRLRAELDGGPSAGTAVIYVDLDGFKEINDRQGHAAGDAVLRRVADRMRAAVRSRDVVGRMGGDEFVVLCPEVGSADVAVEVAGRIADALVDTEVRASVGVVWALDGTTTADSLIAAADAAMYEAKREDASRPVLGSVD